MRKGDCHHVSRRRWRLQLRAILYLVTVATALSLLNCLLAVAARGQDKQALELNQQITELLNAGKYQEAKPLAERALSEIENLASRPDLNQRAHLTELAVANSNLGRIDQELGDYAEAEPLLRRAVDIRESMLGSDDPAIAPATIEALISLASLYLNTGDLNKAEPLLQRAQEVCNKFLGLEHELTALTLNELGVLYQRAGDYLRAEALYKHSLELREKLLGPAHPDTVFVLENLASIYQATGDYPTAISLVRRVLAAYARVNELNAINIADGMSALADLYLYNSDTEKALTLYERALEIREEELGPENSMTARSLDQLEDAYFLTGNFAKAAQFGERALGIAEKKLSPNNPDIAAYQNNLAMVYLAMGKNSDALKLTRASVDAQMQYLEKVLSFTSEQQRLAFVSKMLALTQFGTLGSASDVARTVLRLKGVVLDSILEDRLLAESSVDPDRREIVKKLRSAKQHLMELTLEASANLSAEALQQREAERKALEAEADALQESLARQISGLGRPRRALEVTVEQVQAALPAKTALVEYVIYDHYLGGELKEWRYGAVVICKDGAPRWVSLSTRSLIDRKIRRYQRVVHDQAESLKAVLRSLNEQVWADVEKVLPADTEKIIISPDGELNFLSFATLLTSDERFLAEKYSLSYVVSGRDLLRKVDPSPDLRMTIFADPDFDFQSGRELEPGREATGQEPPHNFTKRDLDAMELFPLPGTAKEAGALQATATTAGWRTEVYRGKAATESELRKVQSPRILHLATHAFFLPVEATQAPLQAGQGSVSGARPRPDVMPMTATGEARNPPKQIVIENPMYRSGLALAGAQTTLRAWAHGKVPPTEDDGIVTAEEVGGLNLKETWLVTLSACDTGSGEAVAGEGVMGLRRGFMQAGAQNLLMTLWSVADEETANLMVDFYNAAVSGNNAPQALADVQREWLARLRQERGLQAAVTIAGPFIMNLQGPVR